MNVFHIQVVTVLLFTSVGLGGGWYVGSRRVRRRSLVTITREAPTIAVSCGADMPCVLR